MARIVAAAVAAAAMLGWTGIAGGGASANVVHHPNAVAASTQTVPDDCTRGVCWVGPLR
jgi:hypothetical protein